MFVHTRVLRMIGTQEGVMYCLCTRGVVYGHALWHISFLQGGCCILFLHGSVLNMVCAQQAAGNDLPARGIAQDTARHTGQHEGRDQSGNLVLSSYDRDANWCVK